MPQNEIHVWRVAHPYRSRQLKSFLKLNCQAFKPVNEVSDFHAVKIVNTTSGIWQKKFIYLSESTRQQSMLFGCKPSRLSGANLPLFKGGQLGPGAQLYGAQFATFSGRTPKLVTDQRSIWVSSRGPLALLVEVPWRC